MENRNKNTAQWFYETYAAAARNIARVYADEAIRQIYSDEAIRQAPRPQAPSLPPLLKAARSLEQQSLYAWQSRELVFLKQAKLLANYEDDCPCDRASVRYYPTYQSLTDQELRGYFTWRTRLRHGKVEEAPTSFAFLYIYELLNQVGADSPADAYEKLCRFRTDYAPLDGTVEPYLDKWMPAYILYYDLPESLLASCSFASFDRNLLILAKLSRHTDGEVARAVGALAPRWLERSRFYAKNRDDMDRVLARVLRGISAHYDARCKRSMVEALFGPRRVRPIRLFESAVFVNRYPQRDREVTLSPVRCYRCSHGNWTEESYTFYEASRTKLENLTKAVDCVMRQQFGDRHPVMQPLDTKWILKLIDRETQALLDEKKQAEQKKLHLDFRKLDTIRKNAELTREKLIVDEEEEPFPTPPAAEVPAPVPSPASAHNSDCPLDGQELRFLRCLLTGEDTGWLRQTGALPAVVADRINEKLYDTFADTVLTVEDCPAVIEDYAEELKEMVSL